MVVDFKYVILDNKVKISEDKTHLKINKYLSYDERKELLNKYDIDYNLYSDSCYGSNDNDIGFYNSYHLDLNKANKGKYSVIEKLFNKLSNDNRYDFRFEIYYKYSANVKSYNRSYSGSYDNSLPERMKRKDLKELKKYFKNVEFEGRYSYEGKFNTDGYLWIVDFDSIKIKEVEKYLNEEIVSSFELGEIYQIQEDFIYDNYKQMKAGTIFKVKNIGSGWDNHTKLEVISGFFKINKSAPITEFEINSESKFRIFSYDPYGISIPNVKKIAYPIPLDNSINEFDPKKYRKKSRKKG